MTLFRFRQFAVDDHGCGMKVCSDSVLLGAWAFDGIPTDFDGLILDAGTGSGLLALMMALRFARTYIYGADIDAGAYDAARRNFADSPWVDRLKAIHGDFTSAVPSPDLIIANPPYFANGAVSPTISRATARHAAGLSYASLFDYAREVLTTHGRLAMVSPYDAAPGITCHAAFSRMHLRRRLDVSGSEGKAPNRILWEFAPEDGPVEHKTLIIRRGGAYTPEYLDIVNSYYLFLH